MSEQPEHELPDGKVQVPAKEFDWIYDPNETIEVDDEELEEVPQPENPEEHPDNDQDGQSDDIADEAIDAEVREGLI